MPHALFRLEEDTQGYFRLLEHIVAIHGIPLAIYRDRHSIFETPPRHHELLEGQLAGEREPTQFGRLLGELGITSIPSNSPQGRGRIERLWGTFQDRLVSELRLAGAQDMAQANQVVAGFLPRYNHRFMLPAARFAEPLREAPLSSTVFPEDANAGQGKISVLAPIGTAMLGYEVGDVFEWEVPAGKRRWKIKRILYQPEAAGDHHL